MCVLLLCCRIAVDSSPLYAAKAQAVATSMLKLAVPLALILTTLSPISCFSEISAPDIRPLLRYQGQSHERNSVAFCGQSSVEKSVGLEPLAETNPSPRQALGYVCPIHSWYLIMAVATPEIPLSILQDHGHD